MRIAFLCGSFEPGRDGVGDYVAQFARALTALGHACQVVALADRYADAPRVDVVDGFEVVRLPAARWRAGDVAYAASALRRFAPVWVSLQLVSYAYEQHGLLLRAPWRFAALATDAKRHVMLHELWIGANEGCSRGERLLGAAQRWSLRHALRRWAADATHTSTPAYRALLARAGVQADILRLPGNIPLALLPPQRARELLLRRCEVAEEPVLAAGVFGTVHPEWVESARVDALAAACEVRGCRLLCVHVGRAGGRGGALWSALQRRHGARVRFAALGELPAAEVSAVLQGLDLGVATTPWALVGKSGAVAAMLEHGLPVVVTRTDYRLRNGATPQPLAEPGLYRFDEGFLALLRGGELPRRAPHALQDSYRALLASFAAPAAPAAIAARVTA